MQKFIFLGAMFSVTSLFGQDPAKLAELESELAQFKTFRNETKMKADIAGRNADRMMTENWVEYRREIQRQEALEQDLDLLDAKISELESQRAALTKS